jgi:hypothetical protein
MRRRHAGERLEAFRRRLHEAEGWEIRDRIACWARSAAGEINWPLLPPQITDRNADVWEALIAVADAIGGEWPDRTREAAVALVAESRDVEPSLGVRLLQDLRNVFGDAQEIPSKALLHALHEIEEAPWADLKGKPLDERGLAHRLRQYGVKPKTIRVGTTTPKGYARADLVDVWQRYLPLAAASATSATSATANTTSETSHAPDRAGAKDREHDPSNVAGVAAVALLEHGVRVCAHCKSSGGSFCEGSLAGETLWLHAECKDHYRPD